MAFDAAVVGGGIIGAAAAAMLAEEGLAVVLVEREQIAAGASGRNSGALQQPFDELLAELYRQSLPLYRQLAAGDPAFQLADRPAGLLLVGKDGEAARSAAAELHREWPALASEYIPPAELQRLEPTLAADIGGCLLATGYPVVPAAATLAYARLAERRGAVLRVGAAAAVALQGRRAVGVNIDGEQLSAGRVLLAAGPWTPGLVPDLVEGWAASPPIRPTYGVLISTRLERPPGHVLEELGFDPGAVSEPAFFSLVTADGLSSVGSTFFETPVETEDVRSSIIERALRFVPSLAGAATLGLRVCRRPVSFDGRPLIGGLAGVEGLFVCAGHGPWGLSTGPASARLVVELMLGRPVSEALAGPLRAQRWTAPLRAAGAAGTAE